MSFYPHNFVIVNTPRVNNLYMNVLRKDLSFLCREGQLINQ